MEEYNANKLSCQNFGNSFSKISGEENIKEMHFGIKNHTLLDYEGFEMNFWAIHP